MSDYFYSLEMLLSQGLLNFYGAFPFYFVSSQIADEENQ